MFRRRRPCRPVAVLAGRWSRSPASSRSSRRSRHLLARPGRERPTRRDLILLLLPIAMDLLRRAAERRDRSSSPSRQRGRPSRSSASGNSPGGNDMENRIMATLSHWMTFSGLAMISGCLLLGFRLRRAGAEALDRASRPFSLHRDGPDLHRATPTSGLSPRSFSICSFASPRPPGTRSRRSWCSFSFCRRRSGRGSIRYSSLMVGPAATGSRWFTPACG